MESIKDKTAIVGIGWTKFGTIRYPLPESAQTLAIQAIKMAIDDAGLKPSDIDGMMKFNMDSNEPARIADAMGMKVRFFGQTIWGGQGGAATVAQAAAAVAAGLANYVVCYRSLCQSQEGGFGEYMALVQPTGIMGWQSPFGLFTPFQAAAIGASRHFHLYGTTRDHLANIAMAIRKHANQNPNAFFHDRPMTREDYFKAPIVAYPICRFDCCMENDGACACIVTTAERAKDLKQRAVYIMGAAQGGLAYNYFPQNLVKQVDVWQDENWHMAQQLFRMAGVTHKDIDVLEIYDAFSILVLFMLETLGFCKIGEGGPFTEGGRLEWPDGEQPLNTSGGHLSEAYIHGMNLINNAVRQLRGTAHAQIKDAEIALVSSANAVPSSGLILRR